MRTLPVLLAILGLVATSWSSLAGQTPPDPWTRVFDVEPAEFSSRGRNPFFVLEPGYVLVLEDKAVRLVLTVLDDTRRVNGVETRVVEERETEGERLVEVSRNFFAISLRTNSVFYFGEEVDTYKNGAIVGHDGAWLAGVNGARAGLMMPGLPLLHARYYQEIAPGVAMDRAEIVSLSATVKTPAASFANVLEIRETTPLESGAREDKYYARGVGLVRDGDVRLVTYGIGASRGRAPAEFGSGRQPSIVGVRSAVD
jgi:hypothetical protein